MYFKQGPFKDTSIWNLVTDGRSPDLMTANERTLKRLAEVKQVSKSKNVKKNRMTLAKKRAITSAGHQEDQTTGEKGAAGGREVATQVALSVAEKKQRMRAAKPWQGQ